MTGNKVALFSTSLQDIGNIWFLTVNVTAQETTDPGKVNVLQSILGIYRTCNWRLSALNNEGVFCPLNVAFVLLVQRDA